MNWFSKNAGAIEAAAAIATAILALVALIGVKYQLDAADDVQRAQSAREAYRSHLTLGVAHPEYALPEDACGLLNGRQAGSYGSFVDHLLYSAEQMLEVEPGWETTFTEALEPHAAYVCTAESSVGSTERMKVFLDGFREKNCKSSPKCQ